jgi:2-succinyl-6-hydroxy-2,4-cyclohexadiene-1-carboxylate synthase
VEVVTLLHGFTLGGASWYELATKLPEDVVCLSPDLRGHGPDPVTPCTMDDCAADLVDLWDHLGVERSHVVGYSMGGRLALHVAVRLPERTQSLLTIGAQPGLHGDEREARRERDEMLARRLESSGLDTFVHYWESLPMFAGIARRGPEYLAMLHELRMQNTAAGLAASLRGMGAGAMDPLWDELDAITVPATFVAGEHDLPFIDVALRMANSVRDWRFRVVAGAGHAAQFEDPDATAAVLAEHLSWTAA